MEENRIQYIDNIMDNLGDIRSKLAKVNKLSEKNEETIAYLLFNLMRKQNKLFHYYYMNYIQYGIEKLIKENFFKGDEILINDVFEEIQVKTKQTPLMNDKSYQKTIIDGVTIYHKYKL